MGSYDPIAYTYDAHVHCPECAEETFGRGADGFIGTDSEDSEGNWVGVISPWDDVDEYGLVCGDCGEWIREPYATESELAAAKSLGAEHGRATGTYVFDGNSDTDAIARTLRGMRDIDPAILDSLPSSPLSGEWADGLTPTTLCATIDAARLAGKDAESDVCDAYESEWTDAMMDEVERSGRAILGVEWVADPAVTDGDATWELPSGAGEITVRNLGDRRYFYRLERDDATIFEGRDFRISPMHTGDDTMAMLGILSFLTLRPGDTDDEYFNDYTSAQVEWRDNYAEDLACDVNIAEEVYR